MIILKSPEEIDRIRRAGRITASAIEVLMEKVRPGISTADLDAIAEKSIRGDTEACDEIVVLHKAVKRCLAAGGCSGRRKLSNLWHLQ